MPHTKRIDCVYLHKIHGYSVNKIAKTFGCHYNTIKNIMDLYDEEGRTSYPHSIYCPVNEIDRLQNEVQVLDLIAIAKENT